MPVDLHRRQRQVAPVAPVAHRAAPRRRRPSGPAATRTRRAARSAREWPRRTGGSSRPSATASISASASATSALAFTATSSSRVPLVAQRLPARRRPARPSPSARAPCPRATAAGARATSISSWSACSSRGALIVPEYSVRSSWAAFSTTRRDLVLEPPLRPARSRGGGACHLGDGPVERREPLAQRPPAGPLGERRPPVAELVGRGVELLDGQEGLETRSVAGRLRDHRARRRRWLVAACGSWAGSTAGGSAAATVAPTSAAPATAVPAAVIALGAGVTRRPPDAGARSGSPFMWRYLPPRVFSGFGNSIARLPVERGQ